MKSFKKLVIIAVLLLNTACLSQKTGQKITINENYLIKNLKIISHDSLQGRFFGTDANYQTQQFIAAQFDSIGIKSFFDSGYMQSFPVTLQGENRMEIYPVTHNDHKSNIVPDTTVTGGNVVGVIKGKINKNIVITAHLDHLGIKNGKIFNGADDNASGTAALISVAAYFKDRTPRHNLIFAAVDAEEIGSYGAEFLLENFPGNLADIALNINMDMIAHNDSMQLYASGLYHYPQLKQSLQNLKTEKITLFFGHDNPGNQKEQDWTYSSDHRVFHKREIPYIYFGVEDHEDYHQPSDEFDNINKRFYIEAVKLIIQAIENFDQDLSR